MSDIFKEMRKPDNYTGMVKCLRCKMCTVTPEDYLDICPSYKYFGFNTYCGGGKIQMARGLCTGIVDFEPDMADVVYKCTTCLACTELCPDDRIATEDFNHTRITEWLRQEAAELGYGPRPEQARNVDYVKKDFNPYGKPHEKRLEWLEGDVPEKAGVFYFAGCTASYSMQELAKSTVKALKATGVDFAMAADERCCGSYLLRIGEVGVARDLAERNREIIGNSGAKVVVTSCPGCSNTLHNDYPRLGTGLDAEIKHTTQLLAEAVGQGKLKFKKYGKKVTYHDPCHIGRHMGIYDPPRDVMAEIPGLELVEMPRNREIAYCCGAGGGVKSAYPEWALDTAKDRVSEAVDTGAEVLITACPFCERNLQDAVDDTGARIEIVDLVELVAELGSPDR